MNNDQEKKSSKYPDSSSISEPISGVGQPAAARDFEQGEMVGRYRVLSLIGRGAMGSVYAVEQVLLKKRFALKTLSASLSSTITQKRFQKEAQAASQLDHPNLARTVDFDIDNGRLFLVMDFVEGKPLSEHLKLARLSVEEALSIFIPVCFALAHAHEHGVIHRDIKPSNIVLAKGDGNTPFVPKIIDFGIAKLAEDAEAEALTRTGEVFGTPLYMSPEQCSGIKVDHRSDIYSLGCVLYESLTGTPPFAGQTALETMMQHRMGAVMPMAEASLGLTFAPDVEGIVQKMLAKNADDRYQNCLDLAEDLMRVQRGEAINLAGSAKNSGARAKSSAYATATVSSATNLQSRSRLYLVSALASLAVILTIALFLLRPEQKSHQETAVTPVTEEKQPNRWDAVTTVAEKKTVRWDPATGDWFSTGDQISGKTFHFGNTAADANYTFKSVLSYLPDGEHEPKSHGAQGEITVPPHSSVSFEPSVDFVLEHAPLFGHFKPDDLDEVHIGFSDLIEYDPGAFNIAMGYMASLNDLKRLSFTFVPLNGNGLTNLKLDSKQSLKLLTLRHTSVDGNDLARFKNFLRKLDVLAFTDSKNASVVLKTLSGSKELHSLDLSEDHLTDDDLSIIGDLPNLNYLDITQNSDITPAGLSHLKQNALSLVLDGHQCDRSSLASMGNLRGLSIESGDWKPDEQRKLQKSLPNCHIVFEPKKRNGFE